MSAKEALIPVLLTALIPSYGFESEEASISLTKKHLTNPTIIIMLDNYKSKQINQTSKSCKQSNPIKHNGYEEEEYII